MGILAERMKEKLTRHFAPAYLHLLDDTAKHHGHEGLPPEMTESHLGIFIVSEKFAGLNRVARSRAVHEVVAEEIAQIHAITALKTLTPEEYAALQSSES